MEPGKGYVMIYRPDHPRARKNNYVAEHIVVMEANLGRPLKPGEVVHHINHIKTDNRIENLQLFTSNAEHKRVGHPPQQGACRVCGKRPCHANELCPKHYQADYHLRRGKALRLARANGGGVSMTGEGV